MFGGDAVDDALTALKDGGAFKATVSTNMLKHANMFVDMSIELAQKGELENREVFFPLLPITAENVDEYMESLE